MKKLILLSLVLFTTLSQAQTLTARSINELINTIDRQEFTYKETGMAFGYISTQSCLYTSPEVIIFKNYCFPVREYPARSFTIISREFGMIDIYEEKAPGLVKKDFTISQFPEILLPYLSTSFPEVTLQGLNAMMEKVHYQYNPGCWSTNFSFYTETEDANCTIDTQNVSGFSEWAKETQEIVSDENVWNHLFDIIDSRLKGL